MMSEIGFSIQFLGGKTTFTGKVCTELGADAKVCLGSSKSNQQKGITTITGSTFFGSIETGAATLTVSDEQRVIDFTDPKKYNADKAGYGILKTKVGNTYVVRIEDGKASYFNCADLPPAEGGKYKFEVATEGNALVVSNAKGDKKVCQFSSTHP